MIDLMIPKFVSAMHGRLASVVGLLVSGNFIRSLIVASSLLCVSGGQGKWFFAIRSVTR